MNILYDIILEEIKKNGVLPFARFMELALYHPGHGYYEREKTPGRDGDFYTSVSVGNLFGELLAFQIAEWLETENVPATHRWQLVEAGAHDGRLAHDILSWMREHRPKFSERVEYIILEPSTRRRGWQEERLKDFPNVRWVADLGDPIIQAVQGIVFSNELLDAMPVHRFGWDAKQQKWFEWGVAVECNRFIWSRIGETTFTTHHPELDAVLPDGYVVEVSSAAKRWWREAAKILKNGRLMTIDYGLATDELFSPSRTKGTLRAYFKHRANDDLLANAGEQDITAHVNFSAIQGVGEEAGLFTEFFGTQSKFLTEVLARAAKGNGFGKWDAKQTRQFQTLTHPEHLGRSFRVLVQAR